MDTTQLFVTLAGLGLMGFVTWFFFGAPYQAGTNTSAPSGTQTLDIQQKYSRPE